MEAVNSCYPSWNCPYDYHNVYPENGNPDEYGI